MRDYSELIVGISNAYYDLGLEKARRGDLSGAANELKRSLELNKYQTDSRDLLGLIYYEMGETSDALVQWIISQNLDPDNERAARYIEEIQKKAGALVKDAALIRKFNQALDQAQHGAEDLAIIALGQVVREKPNYVKAHLLLTLLYLEKGDNVKAGRSLMKVLKIDRYNSLGLYLMDETKKRTGKAEVEKNRMKDAFSHRRMEDDDIILPKTKKEAAAGQTVLHLLGGALLGLLLCFMLIIPSVRRSINVEANQRVAENSRELNELNARYSELSTAYESMSAAYDDVYDRLTAFEEDNASFISIYRALLSIENDYNEGDIVAAAESYLELDRSLITEDPLLSMLQDVDRYMQNEGFDQLVQLGTDSWNGGDLEQAEIYYDMALSIKSDDPEALYLKARLLQRQDRMTEANAIFDVIVGEHPESPYAERAISARGY